MRRLRLTVLRREPEGVAAPAEHVRSAQTCPKPSGPDRVRRYDLLLEADDRTTWEQLRPLVAAATDAEPASPELAGVPDGCRLGESPLVPGAVLQAGPPAPMETSGLLELRVLHGPGSGRVFALAPGRHLLGRCLGVDIRLDDAAVSRMHGELQVGPSGVRLRVGAGSATWLDGRPVPAGACVELALGSRLTLGRSTLTLALAGSSSPLTAPVTDLDRHHFPLPEPPVAGDPAPFPVLASAIGVAVSVVLAVVLSSPVFLLLGLASPVVALAHTHTTRRQARRRHLRDVRAVAAEHTLIRARAQQAWQRQSAQACATSAASDVLAAADEAHWPTETDPSNPPWVVAIGLGTRRSGVSVGAAGPQQAEPAPLPGVPLALTLTDITMIRGPASARRGLGRWLICQLAVQWPPDRLRIALATDAPEHWDWFSWIPHARTGTGLEPGGQALIGADPASQAWLVTAIGTRGEDRAGLVVCWDCAREPPAMPGVSVLWLAGEGTPSNTPSTTVIDLDANGGGHVDPGQPFQADLVEPGWADLLARRLARRDQGDTPTGGLPASTRLIDLVGPLSRERLRKTWRSSRGPVGMLGVAAGGPLELDLRHHGPHLLLAGTTGSGKSEALRTLVLGLALNSPAHRLSFVLVDYKGGAAFGPCADLPHTLAVLTDLDSTATARALSSLRAEIARRERFLAAVGAADLDTHERRQPPGADTGLARVVIVVDEFRALAEDLPDFVTGLVRLAAVGRSLGLHLVLATQRPSGVVNAQIRANLTTRLALRVGETMDSHDILDAPDASRIPVSLPGRGLLRIGGDRPVAVQCARVDVRAQVTRPRVLAMPTRLLGHPIPPLPADAEECAAADVPYSGPAEQRPKKTTHEEPPCDADLMVGLARSAASGWLRPAPIWQPPLPDELTVADLVGQPSGCPAQPDTPCGAQSAPVDAHLLLGLLDEPDRQRRTAWCWHPQVHGSLGVVGAPGSGRRTAIRRILAAAAGAGVQTTCLEPSEAETCEGLLRSACDPPAQTPDPAGTADASEQPPLRLLVIADWDDLLAQSPLQAYTLTEALVTLLRRGPAHGVVTVVAGGRAVLSGQLAGLLPTRLALRLPDPGDAALLGVPRAMLPTPWPRGRGIWVPSTSTPQHVQVALDRDDPEQH
ncbi:MAG: FtsK/SpoIIIE domain-containing protein [Actinomycetales bacterium]